MIEGLDDGALIGLAGDLRISAGLDLSLDDLAQRCGAEPKRVAELYGSLGLDVDRLAGFGEDDVELVSLTMNDGAALIDQIGPGMFRVTGRALRRIAEAAVAAYVQDVETSPREEGADLVGLAELNQLASGVAVELGSALGPIFRHHMWVTVRDQREGQAIVGRPELISMGIGFVDLVGFTSRSRDLAPDELMELVEDFEQQAFDAATEFGGQVVKSIGDEVMIAGPSHDTVAQIAMQLVAGFGSDPSTRPRGGVSAGEVVFRLGDFYGPIVNTASRLVDAAAPGEVLTDVGSIESPDLSLRPAGTRSLKGFPNPIEVWSIGAVG